MGQPIESDDVRGLLTEACPGFAEPFAEEDADSSERLNYLEISAAVRWLSARVRDGDESCLPAVFEVAELVLIDGTKSAQDLVVVGLFEDLQNYGVTGGIAWSVWERFLGPLSRDAWQALIDSWGGEEPSPRGEST